MSKAKDEAKDKARRDFKALVNGGLYECRWTKEEIAIKLNMCPATFYNKLKAPENFRVGELRRLEKILHLDRKKLDEIIDKIAA